jgi:hypothetical protein
VKTTTKKRAELAINRAIEGFITGNRIGTWRGCALEPRLGDCARIELKIMAL